MSLPRTAVLLVGLVLCLSAVRADDLDAELAAGEQALSGGAAVRAERIYRRLMREYPGLADPYSGLARALVAQDRKDEALDVLLEIGTGLVRAGDPEAGVEFLERAVATDPGAPRAHAALGQGLMEVRRYKDAATELERTIELGGDGPAARIYLGAALWESGRYEEAEGQYRSIVDRFPEAAGAARQSLGALFLWQGRFAEAVEPLRAAATLVPDSVATRFDLARALEGAGQLERARDTYVQVIELAPEFSQARYRLARLVLRLGDADEAERLMTDFQRLHQAEQETTREHGMARARENHAWELLRRGEYGAAADRFRELPESADTLAGLASALSEVGDHNAAAKVLERALQLDPERHDLRLAMTEERVLAGTAP